MKLMIRQENNNDFPAVFEVNRLAFGQDSEARLVEMLRRSDAFVPELSLVAVQGNSIIGHTKIKIVDQGETESLALELETDALKGVSGVVKYAKEFEAL